MARKSDNNDNDTAETADNKQEEADLYRKAAEDALQQLDWAIGYLHGIHKVGVSKQLAKNRSYIRRQLMGRSEEPMPTEETSET
jgi:hypothetical protein